jgi:DNA-binding transcriptional LysR family regulator
MELYQLRAFAMVARQRSVTRAAERLFTSQPAVSAQIKALEQELGVALFTRTSTGMQLTDDGAKLLPHAHAILQQSRTLEDLSRHLRDGLAGTLRIGLNCPTRASRFDEVSRHLITAHPELSLHFENGRSGTVIQGLKSFDLDVGFAEGPQDADPTLTTLPLGQIDLRIVMPVPWRDQLPAGDWQALQHKPWVFVSSECSHFWLIRDFCEQHQLTLHQKFRMDDDTSGIGLVSRGLAVSVASRDEAEQAADRGEVAIWPGFEASLTLHACALKKREREKPIEAFFQACREAYAIEAVAGPGGG